MPEGPSATLHGTVERVVKSLVVNEPDQAQIAVLGADKYYNKIFIDDYLTDKAGHAIHLNPGLKVEITIRLHV
jgi:hypothetical protein